MTAADDSILEFLDNNPNLSIIAKPGTIEVNIDFSGSTIRKRIRVLDQEGLVEYYDKDKSYYQITELGQKYLRGELTRDELEKD